MPQEAVFTVALDDALRARFTAEAEALDRPAAELIQELIRDFVRRRQEEREYGAFLAQKVAKARESIVAGLGRSNEEVAADFAAQRRRLLRSSKV